MWVVFRGWSRGRGLGVRVGLGAVGVLGWSAVATWCCRVGGVARSAPPCAAAAGGEHAVQRGLECGQVARVDPLGVELARELAEHVRPLAMARQAYPLDRHRDEALHDLHGGAPGRGRAGLLPTRAAGTRLSTASGCGRRRAARSGRRTSRRSLCLGLAVLVGRCGQVGGQADGAGLMGSRRRRISAFVMTAIAPASRSSAMSGRLRSRTPACSSVRRPTRRNRTQARQIDVRGGEQVAEVGVHRHEYPRLRSGGCENVLVGCAQQRAICGVDSVVTRIAQERNEPRAQALVEQEPQAGVRNGRCRSSTAAAANSSAARTSSAVSCG